MEVGHDIVLLDSQLHAQRRMQLPALITEDLQPKIHLDLTGTVVAVSHTEGVSVFDVSSRDGRPPLLWDVRHEPWHGAAGQDGSFLWQLRLEDPKLSIRAFDTIDRIMGGFDAHASRFVTAPHHAHAIRLHRRADGAVVDELPHRRVFRGDVGDDDCDWFDYCAFFLDDARIVANTRQQRF